jgi:transcriptional regulator with XRE-family HTH domain
MRGISMASLPKHLARLTVGQRRDHEEARLKILTADTFGLLLEDLRISQAELAERLGMSEARVSKILSGSQNLTLRTIARLAFALGVRFEPRLVPAQRDGTPAADDPQLPSWVNGGGPAVSSLHVRFGHLASEQEVPSLTVRPSWVREVRRVSQDA